MKLLVLSSRAPWPPQRADQMTVDRLIRFLADRGHGVDLVCFVENAEEERALRAGLGTVCRRIHPVVRARWRSYVSTAFSLPRARPMQVAYFASRAMRRKVQDCVASEDYDLVYVHLIRMAEYARHLGLPKVIGLQVSQALNLRRLLDHAEDPLRGTFYRIEARKVRPYEARVCADFDRVILCGSRDVEEIERTAPLPHAEVCPHGQDVPALERVRAARREPAAIVMSGVMATYTNVDAASWFAREIFPRVRREIPEASLWLVGREPRREIRALGESPGIVVTGEVPDVYDYLCRAAAAVDPLRIGAGMQNKILEAMACECPVVATSVANEGIGARPGKEIILRDDPASFAHALIALLQSAADRRSIGRAGRRFVEANWTWEARFERLHSVLLELAAEQARATSRATAQASLSR